MYPIINSINLEEELDILKKNLSLQENITHIHFSLNETKNVTNAIVPLLQVIEDSLLKFKELFIDYCFEPHWTENNIGQLNSINMESWRGQLYFKEKIYSFYNYRVEYNDFNVYLKLYLTFNKYDWMLNFCFTDDDNRDTYPHTPIKKKYSEELAAQELENTKNQIIYALIEYIKLKIKKVNST